MQRLYRYFNGLFRWKNKTFTTRDERDAWKRSADTSYKYEEPHDVEFRCEQCGRVFEDVRECDRHVTTRGHGMLLMLSYTRDTSPSLSLSLSLSLSMLEHALFIHSHTQEHSVTAAAAAVSTITRTNIKITQL